MPKKDFQYSCFSVIFIDSVFRAGKNYYLQVFLEEWKYVVKEKKMLKCIIKDIEISSDESYKKDSDEENTDKENSDEDNHR